MPYLKRVFILVAILSLIFANNSSKAIAAPQFLPELGYKYYPLRDLVFVDFHNPYFTPVDNIIVNMIVREGTGRNRTIAIGQARMPSGLVLMPGEHTSARVPIRARVVRDIPALAQFEFRIMARQLDGSKAPPEIVVQDSSNGTTLQLNRDANGVPFVMGFIGLNPGLTEATTAKVDMAILTFYDQNHQIVWSEYMPINGKITNDDSFMVWGKYEQASTHLVPDIATVEAKFVVSNLK